MDSQLKLKASGDALASMPTPSPALTVLLRWSLVRMLEAFFYLHLFLLVPL